MCIFEEYYRIMSQEIRLKNLFATGQARTSSGCIPPDELSLLISQLVEVAKNSLVPRSYIANYGLGTVNNFAVRANGETIPIVYESVAAHTNLLAAFVDRALSHIYGPDFGEAGSTFPCTTDNYTYREIMEVVRLHDLPENDIGDIPDNDSITPADKELLELKYFSHKFYNKYPNAETHFKYRVFNLLNSMGDPKSSTGKLLHVADKASAIFMALTYDSLCCLPVFSPDGKEVTDRDANEIRLCDFNLNGQYKASEMWSVDFFHIRKIAELDDTNFFTSIIVLYTLMVNGHWYNWREDDYRSLPG